MGPCKGARGLKIKHTFEIRWSISFNDRPNFSFAFCSASSLDLTQGWLCWRKPLVATGCVTMPGAAAADRRLLMEVEKGSLSGVKKLLAGGANVNGSPELEHPPIMGAAR